MVQVSKTLIIYCLMIFPSTTIKMIWKLDSLHQNSYKPLSSSNSYALTHQKLISKQLYSSDKMIIQVTKTPIFYVWWFSTQPKVKMIWSLDSPYQNSWKALSFNYSYVSSTRNYFQVTLQQWQTHGSSNKSTPCLFVVWTSCTQQKAKMIWSLDSPYQNSWKSLAFSNSYHILPIFKNCSSLIKIIIFVGFMILSKIM